MKLDISSAKTKTCQLRWFVLIVICFKCIRRIELDRYEIYYSINDYQMNNKSHDFSFM